MGGVVWPWQRRLAGAALALALLREPRWMVALPADCVGAGAAAGAPVKSRVGCRESPQRSGTIEEEERAGALGGPPRLGRLPARGFLSAPPKSSPLKTD